MWPDFLEADAGALVTVKSRSQRGSRVCGVETSQIKSNWPVRLMLAGGSREQKASGKPEPLRADRLRPKRRRFAQARRDLTRGLGHPRRKALEGSEDLLGKLAVESPDLVLLGQEALASLLGEFGLNLNGLVERAHGCEFLDKRYGLLERPPG